MNKIDTVDLISDIEDALTDNGIMLEVISVAPEEVEDNVKYLSFASSSSELEMSKIN